MNVRSSTSNVISWKEAEIGQPFGTEIFLSQQVRSPNLKQVNLPQSPGTVVSESGVLVTGQVKGANVIEVKIE